WHIILAGVTTVGLIPIMMFLTLIFKNFMAGMIITVGGTIANVLILNWEKSYLSPFAVPADITMIVNHNMDMNVVYPIISICAYLILFLLATMIYFKLSDQNT
ncbi:MAG: hypothetical protein Q8920_06080, partial [Bacillota bacterium]|nr:hypothetical protein [Bacillota bacterium]